MKRSKRSTSNKRTVVSAAPSAARRRARPKPVALVPFDASRFLTDDRAIAEYLNQALRSEDPRFLLVALGDVARARGMSAIARETGLGRENLYKALSPRAWSSA